MWIKALFTQPKAAWERCWQELWRGNLSLDSACSARVQDIIFWEGRKKSTNNIQHLTSILLISTILHLNCRRSCPLFLTRPNLPCLCGSFSHLFASVLLYLGLSIRHPEHLLPYPPPPSANKTEQKLTLASLYTIDALRLRLN